MEQPDPLALALLTTLSQRRALRRECSASHNTTCLGIQAGALIANARASTVEKMAKHKEAEWREKAKANGVSAQTCHSFVAAPLQPDLPQDLGNVARCIHGALQRQQHCNISSCLCILHAFTNDLSRNPGDIFRNQLAQHSSSQPTCYTPTIWFDCILCLFHSYTALCYASRIKYLHSNKSFTMGLITKSDFTCPEQNVCSTWQVTFLALIKELCFFIGKSPFHQTNDLRYFHTTICCCKLSAILVW